ncbi:MAG TPA: diaminopimelate decarboxylase, partial [Acidimicrobiales bacterium]|nr:diaminopimelate decarboxylase [Acidimicrobiales bacterium]
MTTAPARVTAPSAPEAAVAKHLLPITADVDARGRLSIAGVDLLDLAEDVGTPVFVYDEEHLRVRCREAKAAFGAGVAYATKAFLCKAMAVLAHEEGLALDVSTGGELAIALAAGVPADRLVMHGSNKSCDEIAAALDAGVGRLVVDSFDEIARIEAVTSGARTAKVLVRVTPGVEAHTHEYVMTGQDDSKFGFGLESGAAGEAVARLRALPGVEVVGVHAHIGSQIFRVDSFAREAGALAPFAIEFDLPELCVGGGLGVAYLNHEVAPTIVDWAATVRATCAEAGLPKSVKVTAEPGRAIVATAGITLYTVGTVKELPGIRRYVSVDGGMSDNPRPVLYGSGYEAFLPREANAPRPLRARIVGKHCESGDVVVEDARLPADLAVGDILATPVTGAYGHSMASNYNR